MILETAVASKLWGVIADQGHSLSQDTVLIREQLLEFQHQGSEGGTDDYPYNNHSGWGLLYYQTQRVDMSTQVWHSAIPALDDTTYQPVVDTLLSEENGAWLAMGHVRRASTGAEEIPNPHPFHLYQDGRSITFAHNGTVSKTALRSLLTNDYETFDWIERIPPDSHGCGHWLIDGWDCVVDSELYFRWILMNIDWLGDVYLGKRAAEIRLLDKVGTGDELNTLLMDGTRLYGFRSTHSSDDTHDLFYAVSDEALPDPYGHIVPLHSAVMSYPPQDSTAGSMDWINLDLAQGIVLKPGDEVQFYSADTTDMHFVPQQYATIQSAIDAAEDGDVIILDPGSYETAVNFQAKRLILTSRMFLTGDEAYVDSTIILNDGSGVLMDFSDCPPQTAVAGLTLNAGSTEGSVLYGYDSDVHLSRNHVIGSNQSALLSGGFFDFRFSDCRISGFGEGLAFIGNSSRVRFDHCLMAGNGSADGSLFTLFGGELILRNSTLALNSPAADNPVIQTVSESQLFCLNSILWNEGAAEISGGGGQLTILYSDVEGGQTGIELDGNCALIWGAGNLNADPQFADATGGDFSLLDTSPCVDAGSSLIILDDEILLEQPLYEYGGAEPDMGASQIMDIVLNGCTDPWAQNYDPAAEYEDGSCEYESFGTVHVPDMYPSIQAAVNVAGNGDTILVAPGVWLEPVEIINKDLILASHYILEGDTSFISQTILDGLDQHTPLTLNYTDPPMEIAGFTVTNGSGQNGGGLYLSSSEVLIHHTNFLNCHAGSSGGAVYASSSSYLNAPVELHDVRIENCTAGNSGGGFYSYIAVPTIRHCVIRNNSAVNGGGLYMSKGVPVLERLVITGNAATRGGALYLTSYSNPNTPVIGNCTLTGNTAEGSTYGAALYISSNTNPVIYNSIFWENTPAEIGISTSSNDKSLTVLYSNITGGMDGIPSSDVFTLYWLDGNIAQDPLFSAEDDVHLQETSPCIDAGASWELLEYGDGLSFQVPQIFYYDDAPDMGCFEVEGELNCTPGDVNADEELNVLDIVLIAQIILDGEYPGDWAFCASDMNQDGSIDILDVVILVGWIMEG